MNKNIVAIRLQENPIAITRLFRGWDFLRTTTEVQNEAPKVKQLPTDRLKCLCPYSRTSYDIS